MITACNVSLSGWYTLMAETKSYSDSPLMALAFNFSLQVIDTMPSQEQKHFGSGTAVLQSPRTHLKKSDCFSQQVLAGQLSSQASAIS